MENFFSHPKLSEIQDTDLQSILKNCYTHLENGYNQNYLSFLSNISTLDLIKFAGIFLEKQNAYSKLKSNFKQDWYEIDLPHHQTDRQQVYLSNLECINILFTNLFSSEHYQTKFSEKTALFDTQNEQKLIALLGLLHQKKALDNFMDFVIYDKWDYRVENQHLKVEPKNEISKKNFLRSCSAPFKLKAESNYTDKFINTFLFSLGIDIEIIQNQRPQFVETFLGYDINTNNLSIDLSNAKGLVDNCPLDFKKECLTEQLLFSNYHLSQDELKITLTNGDELNVSNILRIGVLLKRISRLHIKKIDKSVKMEENREDDPMLQTPTYQDLDLTVVQKIMGLIIL